MKIAKTLKRVSLLFFLLFPLLVQPTSALEYSTRFTTCAQMKKQYRFGVALSLKITGDYPAKISKLIYMRNEGLDFDYDGIVCENELLQNNLDPSTKSTTTTSIAVPSVTATTPLPTSPVRLPFKTNGSTPLRKGVTYQFVYCSERADPIKYFDILSISTGWTQKGIGTHEAMKCGGFPYTVTYSWIVTESPGEVSKIRLRGYNHLPEMNIVVNN